MKVLFFIVILAFASAKPYEFLEQKNNEVSAFWHQFLPPQYRQQYWPQEHWQQYWDKYWPQEEGFQVAQYITYQFFQANQNGFTPAQFSLYLMQQGYPEPIVHYLVQEYEVFQSNLYKQSPYHTLQFYYEQRIPEEHFQWLSQQLHHAYQQYPHYYFGNGHQTLEHEYPYHSIAQFVNQQAYYYAHHDVSYKAAQYAYQQLQQVEEYVQNIFQYLKNSNVPKETYQYLFQELQQGQQYIQFAQKVYVTYQNAQINYIPYYAAMYLSEQIHHAYQHFQNVYQFIYQQQSQGNWPQDANFVLQQVQFVYQTIKDACKVYSYNPYDTTHYTPTPTDENYQLIKYSPSYWPLNQHSGSYGVQYPSTYQYGPYDYGYHGFNINRSIKPYQYEAYKPSYPYNYGIAVAA